MKTPARFYEAKIWHMNECLYQSSTHLYIFYAVPWLNEIINLTLLLIQYYLLQCTNWC